MDLLDTLDNTKKVINMIKLCTQCGTPTSEQKCGRCGCELLIES